MKQKILVGSAGMIAILLLLGAVGCGSSNQTDESTTIQPATSSSVGSTETTSATMPEESSTTEAAVGTTTASVNEVALPADWPDDLPIYPDAKVIVVATYFSGEGDIGVTMDSTDDPKTVNDWYVDEVQKAGWEITGKAETNGNYVISGVKGSDQLTVAIAVGLGTPNTSINVSRIVFE